LEWISGIISLGRPDLTGLGIFILDFIAEDLTLDYLFTLISSCLFLYYLKP
jgi:hypothetical protein